MNKWKKYVVEGTNDILFEQCAAKNVITKNIRSVFQRYGFLELQTPTLEFYDVFNFSNHPVDDEKIYKLVDYKGRILTLRPDFTIPIARVYSTKIKKGTVRLSYFGQVYRANEHNHGKNNEITQCGIEIIGAENIRAEILLLLTAIDALKEAGIDGFKIEIGQSQFYKALIEELKFDEEEKLQLQTLTMNRNIGSLYSFLNSKRDKLDEKSYELLKKLPQLFGGIEIVNEAEKLIESQKALKALGELRYIYDTLNNLGYSEYISIDLAMIQDFDYYTGAVFKGYVRDFGEEILSGGRYDSLIGEFGDATPAAGLGLNIDNILKVLTEKRQINDSNKEEGIIYFDKECLKVALGLLGSLNNDNIKWNLSLQDNLQDAIKCCKNAGISNLIQVTEKGVFKYKIDGEESFVGEMTYGEN